MPYYEVSVAGVPAVQIVLAPCANDAERHIERLAGEGCVRDIARRPDTFDETTEMREQCGAKRLK